MKTKPLIALPVLLAAFVLVGCADESPEKRIASAKEYLQKKDTKSAVIEIKNALQKNPELGEARYLLGSTLLAEGNVVAAEVELRKALAAKHPDVVIVPDLARSMLMLGQAKKVVDEFGSTRLGQPGADASLQTTLVAAYAAVGKPEQAQAALNAALAADAQYAPALLISARQKAGTKDFDSALAVVEDVVTREPGNTDAWKLKGDLLLYTKNKPDDALAAYRKALEVNPKYGPAHFAVLNLLMQQGKLDDVAKQLEQLKTFAANNPQTKYFEAQLAYQKKDFKRAQEVVQPLLQQAPNNAQLLQLAGAVELQLGAVAQAEIYLSKATQLAPQLAPARRLLIATYLRSGQSAKALTALNASTGKDGIEPALYSLAGEVYLQNGDAKKAEEYFAKALKLDPDNARKRTAVAITHLASGQTADALGELQDIAASDSGVTADLALISAHVRRKEFDKALAAIDKLEAKQPDKPMAANLRGRIHLAQKNNAAARKSFERALAIDPNFFAAAASLAALDVADKKPDDAKKRFEALLAKNPKNGQALLALAQLAAVNNAGKDEVAALLTKAVDANPTDVAPRLLLIDLYLRNKDNKQALATAQSAVTAVPSSPELLAALGRVQQVSGDLNQAIATYSKLVALQPLSPVPHVRLAEAHVANKDNKAAEQSLRKALDIKPDFLEAQRGLIILAVQAKMYPDAIKLARTVQEQRPKIGLGLMLEGDVNVARKDWPAAAAAYKAALQLDAATELATKLHAATIQAGKVKDAEQFAATWITAHPKDARFSAYLAEAALGRKDYAAAEKLYLGVLQIQPDSALALNNLAWVTLKLQKDGALAYSEKANQLAPQQPQFMDTLAMVLSAKGEHAKAIELQTRAVALQPANNALKLNLARIYVAAGDKARARTELDALAKLDGRLPIQSEVAELLKTL
jgi:putative PEP-CTERM system TPR-repeat lipoprotein